MPEGAKENRGPKEAYPDTVGQRRSASLSQPAWNFDIKIPLVRGVPLKPRAVRRNVSQIETHYFYKESDVPVQTDYSPWGEIQALETLYPGIHLITTPGHGGIMAEWPAYLELSVAARKCGFRENGCLWFEEDCCEQVVLRELLDRGMWTLPDRISDLAKFEEGINRIIQQYHPDYWSEREAGRTVPQTRKVREKNNLSIRKGEQADKAI